MKLCVSSTSMMNPVLLGSFNRDSPNKPPTRLLGLLSLGDSSVSSPSVGMATYSRPQERYQNPTTESEWQFLELQENAARRYCAVFGYLFDGKSIWYRVWNTEYGHTQWLRHSNSMIYSPYDLVVMDALLSLLPKWNKQLYPFPALRSMPGNNVKKPCLNNRVQHSVSGSPCDTTLMVSDSAVLPTGELWFLVSITPDSTALDGKSTLGSTKTGWISIKTAERRAA